MTDIAERDPSPDAAPDSRAAILEATRGAIADRGVRGMRLESIAAAAGVSVPLLYYHFESRAGLIRAVMRDLGEAAPSERLRERDLSRSAFTAIRDALHAELDDEPGVRRDALVWGEIGASAVFDEKLRDELARVNAEWRRLVAEAIEDGVDDGSITHGVEPPETAEVLVALIDGLCTRWLAGSIGLAAARSALDRGMQGLLRPEGD